MTGGYHFDIHPGGSQQILLGLIPPDSKVLDVGCASGYLGSRLAAKGCTVWGIEQDAEAYANIPQDAYVEVLQADVQQLEEFPWPAHGFDVILAADVLEHLVDPVRTLQLLRRYLRQGGRLLVSLPNIAHLSVRLGLLSGRFRYEATGIMDRTHLHLYTFATAVELLHDGGFAPERILAGSDRFGIVLNRRPRAGRLLRGLLAYNIVVEALPQESH